MKSRATRLAAGWAIALSAAIVLNLAIARPIADLDPAVLAGVPSSSPAPSAPGYSDDLLPPFPTWPLPRTFSGGGQHGPLEAFSDFEAAALQAATDRARADFRLDALAVGVSIRGTTTWAGASGLARDGRTPLDGHSPFGIASITKTFVTALVLQLVEDGRLALDDEVAAYLPGLRLPAGITVEHLLSHTSGLADLLIPMRSALDASPERIWTGPEVVARVGRPWFAPGASYAYSNTNFVVLGLLVERVTGNTFAREVSRRFIEPFELEDTGVLLGPNAPLLITPSWASAFGTSGHMYSSASNLLTWADALYRGSVVSDGSLAHMLTFTTKDYALGTERIRLGERFGWGHSGLLRGFTSVMVYLPQEDISLVVIGTTRGFDPGRVLLSGKRGEQSILDLALAAAAIRGQSTD